MRQGDVVREAGREGAPDRLVLGIPRDLGYVLVFDSADQGPQMVDAGAQEMVRDADEQSIRHAKSLLRASGPELIRWTFGEQADAG